MQKLFSRFFPVTEPPEPIPPGMYQGMFPPNVETPNRLHLRIEEGGNGLLLINAATVLHLNATAAEHVYYWLNGKSEGDAAQEIARRYRVSQVKAFQNQHEIREQLKRIADTPDLDPVLFIGIDRTEPYGEMPSAPYRLDCALTYRSDKTGTHDPLARARVDKELSTDDWKVILSKAWDFGIPHVTFTGGEPCLWDDLPTLVTFCEELGQVTGLLTNGERLAEKSFLKKLDQAGLDHILVTYLPDNPTSLKGLKAALKTDIFTATHILISGPEDFEILDEMQKLGVAAVSLSSHEKSVDHLEEARDHAAALGLDLIWDLPVPYSKFNPISLELESSLVGDGRGWLYIEPDGDVLPAQGIDHILGNVLTDPWPAIWEHTQSWITSRSV